LTAVTALAHQHFQGQFGQHLPGVQRLPALLLAAISAW
jgi:hypothetical protein